MTPVVATLSARVGKELFANITLEKKGGIASLKPVLLFRYREFSLEQLTKNAN